MLSTLAGGFECRIYSHDVHSTNVSVMLEYRSVMLRIFAISASCHHLAAANLHQGLEQLAM